MFVPIAPLIAMLSLGHPRAVRVPAPPPAVAGPTYDKEIVRLFQAHCQSCHHPGDIAPFSLTNYEDAKANRLLIKSKTESHEMPPWKPSPDCGAFADAQLRTLTAGEIDLIAKWIDNGAPQGNPADLPQPMDFSGGWALGEPDLVAGSAEPYTPPSDRDEYRCFTMPSGLTEDKYVSAIDIKPGDRAEVHHVIVYLDTFGDSQRLDDESPGPGYQCFGGAGFTLVGTLGGWAPGARPFVMPDDVGMALPANSRIVLQVHYHVHTGVASPDQTKIAVYFKDKKPAKLLTIVPVINQDFTIPALTDNYRVTAQFPVATPWATHLWMVAPHMHLLGRKMNVVATFPDGHKECLINIDNWEFNWQGIYPYSSPLAFPRGTKFSLEAIYDNPTNRAVSWGEATTDEMCIAFLGFTLD
ncbi:MAG TPA: ascorbate-dependent monooxygenase [Thermoanaerobaculia bacterium]|nr:ascorbate-dependent monooxygenase [Thermoanaerobaculia bacterium]